MTWVMTPELQNEIVELLEDGTSLVRICRMEGMPSRSTVLRWQRENPDFDAKCVRAREAQGEYAAESLYEINEKVESGSLDPAAARVISSNLQWSASKLFAKKYGDRITQEIKAEVEVADVSTAKSKLLSGIVPLTSAPGADPQD